jgi:hypothetical protein
VGEMFPGIGVGQVVPAKVDIVRAIASLGRWGCADRRWPRSRPFLTS